MDKEIVNKQYHFLKDVVRVNSKISFDEDTNKFSVDGRVDLRGGQYTVLPVPLDIVTGPFFVESNKLTSLKNFPTIVASLHLSDLPNLSDFSNMPIIKNCLNFKHLPLFRDFSSLRQLSILDIVVNNCGIESLKGCPNFISESLILTSNSKLRTLKSGSPIEIGNTLNCSFSALENLNHDGLRIVGSNIIMRGMPNLIDCVGLYSIDLVKKRTSVHIEGSTHVKKELAVWEKMKLYTDF
jgi:hypothetical protein